MGSIEFEQPLIEQGSIQEDAPKLYAEDGSIDINGNPALKKETGTWKACSFILGNECCERLAYYGIATNLINFIGMSALTLSASVSYLKPTECIGDLCPSPTVPQYLPFFLGLYLVALGTGGIKPCVSAFGADQFDDKDTSERVRKSSFFNWFYFCINIGIVGSYGIVFVQENVGWGVGFGIPTLSMGLSVVSFFFGTSLYRFQKPRGSPITSICQVLVAAFRKMNLKVPQDPTLLYQSKTQYQNEFRNIEHSDDYKFLDKAAVLSAEEADSGDFSDRWSLCTVTQVQELKILIRMFPVWASGIIFSSLFAQISTTFVQQGRAMNCKIGSLELPPATYGLFGCITVIIFIPFYDRVIVQLAKRFTGIDKGFTTLQRMGIGLFFSTLGIASSAIVEIVRLGAADSLTVFWQIPQYLLFAVAEVFFCVGQLEFFYDQSPYSMRSLCTALALLTSAFGNYLNSLILKVVTYVTTMDGGDGWITDDLNKGHLDYFFWLLAGLSILNAIVYVFSAVNYKQKKTW